MARRSKTPGRLRCSAKVHAGAKNSQAKNSDIQEFTARDIRFTVPKSDASTVYATALGWPTSGTLRVQTLGSELPYLKEPVCAVDLLGTEGSPEVFAAG